MFNCEILSISTVEGDNTYKIEDKRQQRSRYIVYNKESQDATCTCCFFQSEGIPCAHILLVLKSLKEIPVCFKVDRWMKLATKKPIFELDTIVSTSYAQVGQQNRMISNAWSQLYKCMDLPVRDVDRLQYVINAAESIQQKLEEVVGGGSMSNTSTDLQTYFGCTVPDIVEIQPPPVSVTKGRAKRMKTGVEKAVEQQTHARMCHYCKQVTSHDNRNCPEKRN